MLIDTHCHLNFNAFKDDADEVIQNALKEGMWMILPGSQISTSRRGIEIAERYLEGVYAAVGLHPIHLEKREVDVQEVQSKAMQEKPWMTFETRGEFFDYGQYKALAQSSKKVVAIGECGLDYYYKPKGTAKKEAFKQRQRDAFLSQMNLALELDLPIILHCRMAHGDMLAMVQQFQKEHSGKLRGVLHSYAGDVQQAEEFSTLGLYFSFNGLIFKKIPSLPDPTQVIASIPLERILVETDSPYLIPTFAAGERVGGPSSAKPDLATAGKSDPPTRNEPLNVKLVAQEISRIKNIPFEEIVRVTTANAKTLFHLV